MLAFASVTNMLLRVEKTWLQHEVGAIKRRLSCNLSERSICVQPSIALPNGNSHV